MKRVRRESWKQDRPRMQLAALVGSAMGDAQNIKEGITPAERVPAVAARIEETLEQILELHAWVATDW
jgi:hypothetical protein